MKSRILSSFIVFVLFFGLLAFLSATTNKQNCVNVYVDFNVLDNNKIIKTCIDSDKKVNALDIMKKAEISLQGTDKYGDQVVCRVNGLPSMKPYGIKGHEMYIETCKSMPAEFAYWAVLIKRDQTINNPLDVHGKWGWADTAISDVYLEPGDSLGLVFSVNKKVPMPK